MIPLSVYVVAQDNESSEVEEVVVKGIKSSLKDAINIKRSNVGVVDALTAEDLGKFPDGNLAEALSRLVVLQQKEAMMKELKLLSVDLVLNSIWLL